MSEHFGNASIWWTKEVSDMIENGFD